MDTSYLINDPAMMDAVLIATIVVCVLSVMAWAIWEACLWIRERKEYRREMGKMRGRRGHRI